MANPRVLVMDGEAQIVPYWRKAGRSPSAASVTTKTNSRQDAKNAKEGG